MAVVVAIVATPFASVINPVNVLYALVFTEVFSNNNSNNNINNNYNNNIKSISC